MASFRSRQPRQMRVRKEHSGDRVSFSIVYPHGQVARAPKKKGRKKAAKAFGGAAVLVAGAAGTLGCDGKAFNNDVYNSIAEPAKEQMTSPGGAAKIGGLAVGMLALYLGLEYARQKARERKGPTE